jgi:hypothetical protein
MALFYNSLLSIEFLIFLIIFFEYLYWDTKLEKWKKETTISISNCDLLILLGFIIIIIIIIGVVTVSCVFYFWNNLYNIIAFSILIFGLFILILIPPIHFCLSERYLYTIFFIWSIRFLEHTNFFIKLFILFNHIF